MENQFLLRSKECGTNKGQPVGTSTQTLPCLSPTGTAACAELSLGLWDSTEQMARVVSALNMLIFERGNRTLSEGIVTVNCIPPGNQETGFVSCSVALGLKPITVFWAPCLLSETLHSSSILSVPGP